LDAFDGELSADHPCRAHQDLIGRDPELYRGGQSHPAGVHDSLVTGTDVAHLAVDDDPAQPPLLNQFAPHDDGRARHAVAGEERRRLSWHLRMEESQVVAAGFEAAIAAGAAESAWEAGPVVEGRSHGDAVVRRRLSKAG